jgi:hypothetical protein
MNPAAATMGVAGGAFVMVDRADGGATYEEGVCLSLTGGPRGGYKSRPRCVLLDANLTQIWDRIGSA